MDFTVRYVGAKGYRYQWSTVVVLKDKLELHHDQKYTILPYVLTPVHTPHSVPSSYMYTMSTRTDSKYSSTCLVSTWVSTYFWLVHTSG